MKEEVKVLNNISSKFSRKMVEMTIARNIMWQILWINIWRPMTYKHKVTTI